MKLYDYIHSKLKVPFQYGVNDCVLFAIGWVEISSGNVYLPALLWKSEKEAMTMLKRRGGLEKILDRNFERIEPSRAVDGDIAMIDGTTHLFSGKHCVSTGKDGLVFRDRALAKIAWRTPCQK